MVNVSHASTFNVVLYAQRECVTPTSFRTNTCAIAQNWSSVSALIVICVAVVATSTSPWTATDVPKPSSSCTARSAVSSRSTYTKSEFRSFSTARANTNTAPTSSPDNVAEGTCLPSADWSRFGVPTITTSPSTATANPKLSSRSRVGLCSFWRNVQSDEGTPFVERVKTYAEPASVSAPCGSSRAAPTTSVSPSRSSDPAK
mmetsp:Transcript_11077/g.46540  ORF Transcript_11077/g.46540 Transcript_11077/m.46540 type:complete len:202 (-) Transcript_11077:421-1026(-)